MLLKEHISKVVVSQVVGVVKPQGISVVQDCTGQVSHELVSHTPLSIEEGGGAGGYCSTQVMEGSCCVSHLKINDGSGLQCLGVVPVGLEYGQELLPCLLVVALCL